MATNKIYVVQSRNFEYNDETYDTSEGGNVVHAYTSQAEAHAAALRLTMDSLRDGGICYLTEKYNVFDQDALGVLEKHELQPNGDYLDYYEADAITHAIKSGQISEDELRILSRGINSGNELFFVEVVSVD